MLQDNKAAIKFVEDMVEQKRLTDLDSEIRAQLVKDLLVRLERHINRTILESLNDEQFTQFEELVAEKNVDNINDFLYKQNINVNVLVAQAMTEFRNKYLASLGNGRNR